MHVRGSGPVEPLYCCCRGLKELFYNVGECSMFASLKGRVDVEGGLKKSLWKDKLQKRYGCTCINLLISISIIN